MECSFGGEVHWSVPFPAGDEGIHAPGEFAGVAALEDGETGHGASSVPYGSEIPMR
jgi:hypothetical protein